MRRYVSSSQRRQTYTHYSNYSIDHDYCDWFWLYAHKILKYVDGQPALIYNTYVQARGTEYDGTRSRLYATATL